VAKPGFWNDNEAAQKVQQKRSQLQRTVTAWNDLNKEGEDLNALIELAQEEEDDSLIAEIASAETALREKVQQTELQAMLSADNDINNAIMTINSGAGGTESQDCSTKIIFYTTRKTISAGAPEVKGTKSAITRKLVSNICWAKAPTNRK